MDANGITDPAILHGRAAQMALNQKQIIEDFTKRKRDGLRVTILQELMADTDLAAKWRGLVVPEPA